MFNKEAKLQTNPHHKKADTRQLRNPFKKAIISLLGITLSVGLYSGMINVPREVQVPEAFASEFGDTYEVRDGEYFFTEQELGEKSFLTIDFEKIDIIQGPDFLDWCSNLRVLKFDIGNSWWQSTLGYISEMPQMSGINSLHIDTSRRKWDHSTGENVLAFDETNIGIVLDKFPNLTDLVIDADRFCYFGENTLESYPNIKSISFQDFTNENCNIDFSKLTHLDSLSFYGADMYTLAINFTKTDYETLKAAGVNMEFQFNEGNTLDEFLIVLDELDRMTEELNVSKDASDTDKINAVITYVLKDYAYTKNLKEEGAHSFYIGGRLSAVFNKKNADGTKNLICGNYTALCSALSKRLGLSPYYVLSKNFGHAYNLFDVDMGSRAYDATWLDVDCIVVTDKNGNYHYHKKDDTQPNGIGEEIVWYDFDPLDHEFLGEYDTQSSSHSATNYPKIITFDEYGYPFVMRLNEEQTINFDILGEQVVAPLALVVSIMSGLGLVVDVVKLQKIKSMAQKMKIEAEKALTNEQRQEIIDEIRATYSDNGNFNAEIDRFSVLSRKISQCYYYIDMNKESYDILYHDNGHMRNYCTYYLKYLFEFLCKDCHTAPNFIESSEYYLNDFLAPEIIRFLRRWGYINIKNNKNLIRQANSLGNQLSISRN